jgi:hypothetical protein
MTVTHGVGVACACVAFAVPAMPAAAQRAVDETAMAKAGEMSVEVSITHTMVDKDGKLAFPVPAPTRFTVVRTRRSARWQTVVTYRKHAGTPTRASSHPLDGARVEFDEDSGATRVYDSAGELNTLLSTDSAAGPSLAQAPKQWLEGLIASDAGRFTRSRDLSEKYGQPVGREDGLDRYLVHREGVVEEVLADPRSALPREINTVRDGILESHIVFDYDRRGDGTWMRRRMRAEQIVPGEAGHRARTTVEFANLSTGGK